MDVSVSHGCLAEVVVRYDFQISVDVSFGVNNNGFTGALATDDIGILGK